MVCEILEGWSVGRLVYWLAGRLVDLWLVSWLVGWYVSWFAGRLVTCLVGWFVG